MPKVMVTTPATTRSVPRTSGQVIRSSFCKKKWAIMRAITGWTETMQVEGGFWSARLHDSLNATASPLPPDYPWLVPLWLTPITSAFLHAGLFHLAMNMLVLVFVGRLIEAALGPPVVGASGAISALLAASFLLFSRRRPAAIGPVPGLYVHMAWLLAAWVGINLLSQYAFVGTALGIAIWAHVGGFIAGLALAVPLARSNAVRRPRHDID